MPDLVSFSKCIFYAADRFLRLAGHLLGFAINLQLCITDEFAEHFLRRANHLPPGTNQPVLIQLIS